MKKYIFLGIAVSMGGAQLYLENKIQFMEQNGWDVFVFSCSGTIFLEKLKPYKDNRITEINYHPNCFSSRRIDKTIQKMKDKLGDLSEYDEIVIESSSPSLSKWGELLAKEIGAKHYAFLLDAFFPNIGGKELEFYLFKLKQNALACTKMKRAEELFQNYPSAIPYPLKRLSAYCLNSIKDLESPILEEISRFGHFDYVIANCGRVSKPYTIDFIRETCSYAKKYPDKTFLLLMIGGEKKSAGTDLFARYLKQTPNAFIFYTGFLFPIPKKIFDFCDVCVGSSGSAVALPNVPTIYVKDNDFTPYGVIGYDGFHDKKTEKKYIAVSYLELLDQILLEKKYPSPEYQFPDYYDESAMKEAFLPHLEALANMRETDSYYDILSLPLSAKQKKTKFFFMLFGVSGTKRLKKIYGRIRRSMLRIDKG